MTKQILPPVHTSFETAYVIADYPYSFHLRTTMRIWIETKGHAQRVVSCTMNPKVAGEVWNKPKAGTYHMAAALYIDSDNGHVKSATISEYSSDEAGAFLAEYAEGLQEYQKGRLIILDCLHRAQDITGVTMFDANSQQKAEIWSAAYDLMRDMGREDLIKKISR